MRVHVIVKRQHAQEHVDGGRPPAQPDLAVPFGLFELRAAELDPLGHCREDVLRALGTDEDVDVEVSRAAGFQRAVAQRDGASDRVRYAGVVERVVDRQQLIAELAHARSLIRGG